MKLKDLVIYTEKIEVLDLLEMFGIKTVSHRLLQLCREA